MPRSFKSSLRRNLPRLTLELLVVVLGITISFWFQDWRQSRNDRAEEARLLAGFAMELQVDFDELKQRREVLDKGATSVRDLLAKANELDDKAIDAAMDSALGYTSFRPSTATYLELRQTGASRLVQDKELLRELIMLYERNYSAATEWDHINRTFVLDRMFPYVEMHGPSFAAEVSGAYAHGYHNVFRALESDDPFRNLLHTGTLFKEGQRAVYGNLQDAAEKLLKRLRQAQ